MRICPVLSNKQIKGASSVGVRKKLFLKLTANLICSLVLHTVYTYSIQWSLSWFSPDLLKWAGVVATSVCCWCDRWPSCWLNGFKSAFLKGTNASGSIRGVSSTIFQNLHFYFLFLFPPKVLWHFKAGQGLIGIFIVLFISGLVSFQQLHNHFHLDYIR